ncbi:enoyl-CoA hydratase/isomerase family protein [Corynebacterium sp. 3HC-13]|uniref:enoyl-CoA hydratase/isomerase family protein n=1 Tax=Corynebacterium poyangense TaxID=2684405 RepID=UPI001CCCB3CB|nr:enoyl-CoA hydratase/isomerase family protein [Corynebacterium poyangense]MBZ8176256.1 enoyl-CoA hydratase/isomerase family protein [Corynebacterium poyangense]
MSNHDHTHDDSLVKVSVENTTGILELNRPRALNSLNDEMIRIILGALEKWKDDDNITQVLVFSSHEKAFCAGGDVRFARDGMAANKASEIYSFFAEEYRMNALISEYPKPYVALIDGIAMGGGLGVSAHGSHRIVTEKIVAAMPEMAIGFVTDVGMSWFFQRMIGALGHPSPALAAFLGLSGYRLDAADTMWSGLGTHLIASENTDAFRNLMIAEGIDAAVAKFQLSATGESTLSRWYPAIEECFSRGSWSAIFSALKNSDDEEFRERTLELLEFASPTSLVATAEVFVANETAADIHQGLANEWIVGKELLDSHDFMEGVRAVLVDKDRNPSFSPGSAQDVDVRYWQEKLPAPRA